MKLLEYLLHNNCAADERTARGLIMRGDVLVADRPVTSPHAEVPEGAVVRLRIGAGSQDVSRGALKLRPALERTGFSATGRIALDLGVSTGGFTQVLLEQGAQRVYAVDVAYGTIAVELRNDPRVVLLERTNARGLTRKHLPEPPERVVGDLSFISWGAVLPAVVPLLAPGAELLLLVKPQFELAAKGRNDELRDGVVRSSQVVADCLIGLYNTWTGQGLNPRQVVPAGVRGAKGNQEFFAFLVLETPAATDEQYSAMVHGTIGEIEI